MEEHEIHRYEEEKGSTFADAGCFMITRSCRTFSDVIHTMQHCRNVVEGITRCWTSGENLKPRV